LRITVDKPVSLIELLKEHYPDSPVTRIKKLLKSGRIRINEKQVTLYSYKLRPGDSVEISRTGINSVRAGLSFPVLYDDQYLIVVNKPPGRLTSGDDGSVSIQEILSEFLLDRSKGKSRAWVVHRLDKEVSGVLLFAKTRELMEQIRENWKETEKHYFALVEGLPSENGGTIKSWLIEDNNQKVHSTPGAEGAKLAITHYRILNKYGDHTLLDVRTETGRKNQIRVHLSEIGCPIVGDRKYGASDQYKRRIRLHASSLSFPHPVTGKVITIKSPMPKGFLSLKTGDEKYK
jgi:23S rRNA pseudouridine1911/1915/1917 synthase